MRDNYENQPDEQFEEEADKEDSLAARYAWTIPIVGVAILLGILVCFFLTVDLFQGFLTVKASCIPLEDPIIDIQGNEKNIDGSYKTFLYKGSVPVQVFMEKSGEGMSVLERKAMVVNSATGDWFGNETQEQTWAAEHCLCPGCNGTDPGICDPCVPLTPNCDSKPPVYACWATIRKPLTSGWVYQIAVHRVRFDEDKARITDWNVIIALIVFAILTFLLIILGVVLGLVQVLMDLLFPKRPEEEPLVDGQRAKKIGPW